MNKMMKTTGIMLMVGMGAGAYMLMNKKMPSVKMTKTFNSSCCSEKQKDN